MQALGRRPDARARHKAGQNPFADDPASCHLLRSSIPLPYGAHWPLPAKASSQRKGSQRAPRQSLTLGRFMECERGPQPCGSKGSSRRRDCRSPLQRATLVIESAALCLAFCVRVSRERRYGLLDNWHSYGCQGDACFKIDRNSFWEAEGLSTDRRGCTVNAENSCNRCGP